MNPYGWNLSVPAAPDVLAELPDLSLVGDVSIFGAFTRIGVLAASLLVFTLVLANFFDAMGTMTGLGKEAGLTDEDGNLPNIGRALVVEAPARSSAAGPPRRPTRSSWNPLRVSPRAPAPDSRMW